MKTKRSLLTSCISLLLCFAMLLGTTFAWFTDVAVSSGNKIQSGTLKIDLLVLGEDDGHWKSVKDNKDPIFNYDKWEPGYTDITIFKVVNLGTLSLKWEARFASEEELSKLAEVIDVYVCPGIAEAYPTERVLGSEWENVGTLDKFINTIAETTHGFLDAGESDTLGIALKMQEDAGNEYQGLTLGEFDIHVVATQANGESDSFGNEYDKDAKWPDALYIAYFQAFTNTYAPVKKLRTIYYEALENENISGLSIATRPDCLSDECIELLKEISEKKYLSIELGLQTSNPDSARLINRGYDNKVFEEAIKKLSALNIDIVVHVIIGLPYETEEDVLNTINYINQFPIKGVKIHLLHVIKNTPLAQMYYSSYFSVLSLEDYTDIVVNAISHLRNDIVLFRLTGDGPKNLLIAPLWSRDKKKVLNTINRKLKVRNITQGQYFQK